MASPEERARPDLPSQRAIDWQALADGDDFKRLIAAKRKFIVPAMIFFIVYYFTLPVLVGYAPQMMARKVWGNVNLAYLFALSQFFMAWALAFLYAAVAAGWDRRAAEILARFHAK
jgi:uncharacterized membrane protein (DUF485 family)